MEKVSDEELPCVNDDVEIYRRTQDDYYSPSIHLTKDDSIGINVGGHVIVMKVELWHSMALELQSLRAKIANLPNDEEIEKKRFEWINAFIESSDYDRFHAVLHLRKAFEAGVNLVRSRLEEK